MKTEELQNQIIAEFASDSVQENFRKQALNGLWDSEAVILEKYFSDKSKAILDVGCGTGRTSIALAKLGFKVCGIDIVEPMITNAKDIAKTNNLDIEYAVGDATNLQFEKDSFPYILFSNQGWSQIPGKTKRINALKSMREVLSPDGILIFTVHPRVIFSKFFFFWMKKWIKFYSTKLFRVSISEIDFGDRFFDKGTIGSGPQFRRQFIHIPTIKEVKAQITAAGLQIIEVKKNLQISSKDTRRNPPVFFVCTK